MQKKKEIGFGRKNNKRNRNQVRVNLKTPENRIRENLKSDEEQNRRKNQQIL